MANFGRLVLFEVSGVVNSWMLVCCGSDAPPGVSSQTRNRSTGALVTQLVVLLVGPR